MMTQPTRLTSNVHCRGKSRRVRDLLIDTRGTSTVEYVLILCLVAVVCFTGFQRLGSMIKGKIESATATLDALPTS